MIHKLHTMFLLLTLSVSILLAQPQWETAIYAEDTWSYFVGTTSPPENWNQLNFDSSNWNTGQGGFGYADGDDNTIITNTLSVFFRKNFNVISLDEILSLAIHADYDDGFVAYINGTEVLRSANMGEPGSQVTYEQTTETDHEAVMYQGQAPEAFVLYPSDFEDVLSTGENVLAVQVHNVNTNFF
ncbi:MAG: hypothetical protein ACJZ1O_06505 [Candidatus Neomarinimicrobiota bacterium]